MLSIRVANIQDLRTVQDLNHGLFLSDQKNDPQLIVGWPFSPTGESYFRDILTAAESVCFIAEKDGIAVGYLAGTIRQKTTYRSRRMSEVENMFVVETSRSSGVGKMLIDYFFEWSKQMKADSCVVDAYTLNGRAIDFYRRNGFGDYSTVLEKVL